MTITIGDGAGAWPRIYHNYVKVRHKIRSGTSGATQGLYRNAGGINYLLANKCKQHINEYWETEWIFAAAGDMPSDASDGARWWMQVTPPWTLVDGFLYCKADPGTVDSEVTIHTRSDSNTWTFKHVAYAWTALDGTGDVGVSATGVEDYYLSVAPGAGETVYIRGLGVSEVVRASLV